MLQYTGDSSIDYFSAKDKRNPLTSAAERPPF
jgi:hypothetical protein